MAKKQLAVLEDLSYKLPRVHTVLHIFNEKVKIVDQNHLVFLVVSHVFDQENVCFFKDFEVTVFVLCLVQGLLSDDDYGNVMSSQISEKSLVLFIVVLFVCAYLGIFVVPLLQKLSQIQELKLILLILRVIHVLSLFFPLLLLLIIDFNHSVGPVDA